MTTTSSASPDRLYYARAHTGKQLMGLPQLMEMAFRDISLDPVRRALLDRAEHDAHDANALLDLAYIMSLMGHPELARQMQLNALAVSRRYTMPAATVERLRLLVIMTSGTLMANMPIEFLLQGSDITLDMLFVSSATEARDIDLPAHDIACIGVCESHRSQAILEALAGRLGQLPRPTLNHPARILATARETLWRELSGVAACSTPPSHGISREALLMLADGQTPLSALYPDCRFPVICRPIDSHAGNGLVKLDGASSIGPYLAEIDSDQFVISPFVDYISADGQYRKYRIAFVGGQALPVHMALSSRWMVHYLNGDMVDRADNREEERHFFDAFQDDFGRRHAQALQAIDERVGLDYYSIDCGETPDGRLLVFECDTGCVAHAMDPLTNFGYKRPHMLKLFGAFQDLLMRAAQDPTCLKPRTQHALLQ